MTLIPERVGSANNREMFRTWSNYKDELTKDYLQAALLSIFERKILRCNQQAINLASANLLCRLPTSDEDNYCIAA